MTRLVLRFLLSVTPRPFSRYYGEEILAVHNLRLAEKRSWHGRWHFALREIAGLSATVVRLWVGSTHHTPLEAGTTGPDALEAQTALGRFHGRAGVLLATGTALVFVGPSLGFGAGLWLGFALIPPALVLVGLGLRGRAINAPRLDQRLSRAARFAAASAVALAALIALVSVAESPLGLPVAALRYPVCLGLMIGAAVFSGGGMLLRQLPQLPAAAATMGVIMVTTGMFGLERLAEAGMWVCLAGWVALALSPWGPRPLLATGPEVAE